MVLCHQETQVTTGLPQVLVLTMLALLRGGEHKASGCLQAANSMVVPGYLQGGPHQRQDSVQQQGALAGPVLGYTSYLHNHPILGQQDIRYEGWFVFWVKPPPKTSLISATAGNHSDVHEPYCSQSRCL